MNYQGIKNTIFFIVLAGILFNVSLFCHFFSMGTGEHSEMSQVFTKSVSFISTNNVYCCTSHNSAQIFSDQVLAAKQTNQVLFLETILGFIFLLGIAFGLNLLDSQNNSRHRHYRDRGLLSRLYNYILQFLSRGILQPQIYNV